MFVKPFFSALIVLCTLFVCLVNVSKAQPTLITRPYPFNANCVSDRSTNCKLYASLGYCGTLVTVKNFFLVDFCCASCNARLPTTQPPPTTTISGNPNCQDISIRRLVFNHIMRRFLFFMFSFKTLQCVPLFML